MDETDRQAEYDANVEAVKAALAHCSKDELLHIAATRIVDGLYHERAYQKVTMALHTVTALSEADRRHAEQMLQAEQDQRARQTVRHLIGLMPEAEAMARKKNAKHASNQRYALDAKQAAKAAIRAVWFRKRAKQAKGRWFAKFARDMQKEYCDVLDDPDTIRKWTGEWEKEFLTGTKE